MLHVLDLERGALGRENSQGGVRGQIGAVGRQRQRDRQKLLHRVHAPNDQRRELADAVAEAQPRLGNRDLEKLFEHPDLGQLHADDRADVVNEGVERGRFASQNSSGEVDLLPQYVAAEYRRRIEDGPHDRSISAML